MLARPGPKEVRSGLGALISKDGRRVVLQRTDYVPSADLLVEMIGLPRPAEVARVYRATHSVPSRPGARSVRDERLCADSGHAGGGAQAQLADAA